jgi:hypothetical protein
MKAGAAEPKIKIRKGGAARMDCFISYRARD